MVSNEDRRRGLEAIRRCRETIAAAIAAAPPIRNPFVHDETGESCPGCGGHECYRKWLRRSA